MGPNHSPISSQLASLLTCMSPPKSPHPRHLCQLQRLGLTPKGTGCHSRILFWGTLEVQVLGECLTTPVAHMVAVTQSVWIVAAEPMHRNGELPGLLAERKVTSQALAWCPRRRNQRMHWELQAVFGQTVAAFGT